MPMQDLSITSRFAGVCEDLLSGLDFFDQGDATITPDEENSHHNYWQLKAQVESRRASELLAWCTQALLCGLIESYELV